MFDSYVSACYLVVVGNFIEQVLTWKELFIWVFQFTF